MTTPRNADYVPFQDNPRGAPRGARWLGPVDPNEPIIFSIHLRPPESGAAPSDRTDHVTADDAGDGGRPPSPASDPRIECIQELADQNGLAVIEVNRAERSVVLWGTAGKIGAAFRITMAHYEHGGNVRRGVTGPLYLPRVTAEAVEDISGLDDGLPDWVSSAIMRQGRGNSGHRLLVSQSLFFAGGVLITLGAVLYWAHAFGRPIPAQTSGAAQIVQRSAVPPSAPASVPQSPVSPPPSTSAGALQELVKLEVAAWSALDAGQLQEAQDNFLGVLALDAGRANAMRGLVTVRRRMAGDNPRVIRQQMAVYQNAIERGIAADKKYALQSLKLLVSAGLAAAQELEAQNGPGGPHPQAAAQAIVAPAPVPSRGDAQRVPTQPPTIPPKPADHSSPPAVGAQTPVSPPAAAQAGKPPVPPSSRAAHADKPVPAVPQVPQPPVAQAGQNRPVSPAPAPRASTAAGAPLPATNRFYAVRIGPILDRDRAAVLVKQLAAGGFPQAQVRAQPGYRVVSEPLPRKTAEGLVATLAARGLRADAEQATGDTVQLLFGIFTTQKDAEALSGRIAAVGYDAWIREGTVYTVHLGPCPSASMAAITAIVKTGIPEAAIIADPVASQALPARAPSTPSSPRPAGAAPAPSPSVPPSQPPAAATTDARALAPNRFYAVRIGPVLDRDSAAVLVKQLAAGGFPQAQLSAQPGYRVVSEPLPRKTAESLAAALAARGLRADPEQPTGDTVQLLFGVFTAQKDAEALSGRIAAVGYDAWIRDGMVYTVHLGPYPSASVPAITAIAKMGLPEAAITTDLVP